jgi:hypothetical protein
MATRDERFRRYHLHRTQRLMAALEKRFDRLSGLEICFVTVNPLPLA